MDVSLGLGISPADVLYVCSIFTFGMSIDTPVTDTVEGWFTRGILEGITIPRMISPSAMFVTPALKPLIHDYIR